MAGGNGEQLLQPRAVTRRTFRLLTSANQQLELVVALAAGVFVKGHGYSLASGGREPPDINNYS